MTLTRRLLSLGVAVTALLKASTTGLSTSALPPIPFVHGDGDTVALWTTTP